jgi:hypothetical protein
VADASQLSASFVQLVEGPSDLFALAAQLGGWPGNWSNLYRYLSSLPVKPAALRHIVLANNHFKPAAAFNAIMYLMNDFPLPARFQAELYAVLNGLPGVRFDRSVLDAAGRHGIGLYMIEEGFLKMEVIINPLHLHGPAVGRGQKAHPVRNQPSRAAPAQGIDRRVERHPGLRDRQTRGPTALTGLVCLRALPFVHPFCGTRGRASVWRPQRQWLTWRTLLLDAEMQPHQAMKESRGAEKL